LVRRSATASVAQSAVISGKLTPKTQASTKETLQIRICQRPIDRLLRIAPGEALQVAATTLLAFVAEMPEQTQQATVPPIAGLPARSVNRSRRAE
jgi:hypothetical protein